MRNSMVRRRLLTRLNVTFTASCVGNAGESYHDVVARGRGCGRTDRCAVDVGGAREFPGGHRAIELEDDRWPLPDHTGIDGDGAD
jgi:hypothetical protein